VTLLVRDVLELPVMRQARVVAGEEGLDTREVTWVAVSEGPIEDFIRDGELILTSGVGLDDAGLARMVDEVHAGGACALCIGVGEGRYFEAAGPAARAEADRRRMPLIELPWDLRFADITRAVVDQILAGRHDPDARSRFTNVVLDGLGFQGIVDRLEAMLPYGAVVLDADLRPLATGARAGGLLEDGGRFGPGLALAVPGPAGGFLYVLDPDSPPADADSDEHTLAEAVEAIAIEAARRQAALDAEQRVRGHALWLLATGSDEERARLIEDAALLGYSARREYRVAVVQPQSTPDLAACERALARRAHGHALGAQWGRGGGRLLVLADDPGGDRLMRMLSEVARDLADGAHAAVAEGTWRLAQLPTAYEQAKRALDVARAYLPDRPVVGARDVRPLLMIAELAGSDAARATAAELLGPLIEYDGRRRLPLLETLEAYLDEGGNASATARRLYLNRHSLLHRLSRIEELTGCSLSSRDDRFILELSLRVHRLGEG
jgi:purine catabolism regulator